MQVVATIITVGDEILIGQIVDTNSAFIGSVAADAGLRVGDIISVSDSHSEIQRALGDALSRSDVVIMTGGLGPTKDDITKKAIADYFGVGMVRDEATYNSVRELLAQRGVDFNELNQSQADIPEGFVAMSNPVGTAPGLYYNYNGKLLFCMAGVPFEMKRLFVDEVLPRVREVFKLDRVVRRTVMVFGLPESELAVTIAEWEDSLRDEYSLAYLPNPKGIRLRLSCRVSGDSSDIKAYIDSKFEELKALIPTNYLGAEDATTVGEVARLLTARGATLAVAESCSGGALSASCTALSGASEWYRGGVVAYSNEIKSSILQVNKNLLESKGAVSAEVVSAMADLP